MPRFTVVCQQTASEPVGNIAVRHSERSHPLKPAECIGYACCCAMLFSSHKTEKSAKTDKRFRS